MYVKWLGDIQPSEPETQQQQPQQRHDSNNKEKLNQINWFNLAVNIRKFAQVSEKLLLLIKYWTESGGGQGARER